MEQTRERKFLLKQFKVISHAISTYEDMNLLLSHLTEGIARAFSIMGASILLYDESSNQFNRVGSYGLREDYIGDKHIDANSRCKDCVSGVVHFENVKEDKCVNHMDSAIKAGINFILSIPVRFREATIGALRLYSKEKLFMHKDDIDALEILTCQLGMAIELNGLENFLSNIKMSIDALPAHAIGGVKLTDE